MPHIIQFHHPIRKDDYTVHQVASGTMLSHWLNECLPASGSLQATCNFNVLDDFDYLIGDTDVISIRPVLGFEVGWAIWAALAVSVAASVYMFTQMPDVGANADAQQASSVYNYNGQGNKPKLDNPVPVQYGRMPHYPDIIAPNWWEYVNNEQYYYQTFSKGIGRFQFHEHYIGETPLSQFHEHYIGETPLSQFDDIEVRVYQPGETVDHFPHIVWTSKEVGSADGQGGLTLEGVTEDWVAESSSQKAKFKVQNVELWSQYTRGFSRENRRVVWERDAWPWKKGQHVVIEHTTDTTLIFEGNLTFHDMGDDGDTDSPQVLPDQIENPLGWGMLFVGQRIIITGAGVNSGTYTVAAILADGKRIEVSNDSGDGVTTFEPMNGVFCRVSEATTNDGTYVCWDDEGMLLLVDSDTLEVVENWPGFTEMDTETATLTVLEKDMEAQWVGDFLSVPADSEAQDIGVDFVFPRGIGSMNNNGNVDNRTVDWELRYRQAGTTHAYGKIKFTITGNDSTPYRVTFWLSDTINFVPGRYEIGCRRLTTVTQSTRVFDEVQWMGLKSVVQRQYVNPEETIITLKIKATNALSQQANQQYWNDSTRILPVRQGDGSYVNLPTRSIADAVIDACRDQVYGAALTDDAIDLDTLLAYRSKWASREDTCDGLFDQPTAFWDALSKLLQTGRSYPRIDFGCVSLWRDEPREVLCKPYSPVNMTPDSFSADIRLVEDDDYDGIEVEWFNPESRKSETLLCTIPGQAGYNPKPLKVPFITNAGQAKREGLFHAAVQAYRRTNIDFTTDLDGWESNYGDVVPVAHDALCWGASGQVIEKLSADDGNQYLQLSGLLEWEAGKPHYLVFNKGNAGIHGPYRVESTNVPDIVILVDKPTEPVYAVGETGQKPSEYMFGPADRMYKKCILMRVNQKSEFEVGCLAVEDDPRVDAYA
ncbi:host specificity factor TipJ family phage tail protein [Photobacterium ganghwense]|uniref:host specificity factor TipJ family phage tail protein n=1 Tax=Photobacterium ganghwense TaxID=320778 RepID=UPI001C2D76BA|nr:host specificity factor TipJ family phage tail protein [Photobacterium ganghwense]MBV1842700.1 phage tail protein [Photobacterium ganghwense]